MTKVRISEDALADLNDGFWFYEVQDPGLGDYFTSCLRSDIEGLKISAGIHPVVYSDYRRLVEPGVSVRDFLHHRQAWCSRMGSDRFEA
jgi:hypothetical protein